MCELCDSLEFAPYEDLASKQDNYIKILKGEIEAYKRIIKTQSSLIESLQSKKNIPRADQTIQATKTNLENINPPSWVNNTKYPVL
jgi:ferritin-like metal-binding protein YciE